MIGFVNQSYITTEGEEFHFSIGVMSSTQLGREVVVVLGTQSDSVEGRMVVYIMTSRDLLQVATISTCALS